MKCHKIPDSLQSCVRLPNITTDDCKNQDSGNSVTFWTSTSSTCPAASCHAGMYRWCTAKHHLVIRNSTLLQEMYNHKHLYHSFPQSKEVSWCTGLLVSRALPSNCLLVLPLLGAAAPARKCTARFLLHILKRAWDCGLKVLRGSIPDCYSTTTVLMQRTILSLARFLSWVKGHG